MTSPLARLRLPLVVVVAFVLQETLLSRLQVHGAQPDLMVLVVALAGLEGGAERGAVVGFGVGLLVDLFLQTPFGLSALTFTLVGYAMGLLRAAAVDAAAWLAPVGAAAGSAAAVVLYAVLDAIVGNAYALHHGLAAIVVVVGAVNGVLAFPGVLVVRWAMRSSPSRPVPASAGAGRWGPGAGR
ncbi:MAG: rod shape-determining protein MreD [Acidimicrobiales bacterium]